MIKKIRRGDIVVAVIFALVALWHFGLASGTFRYRITMTIDDNGKQYTGSSVVQVHQKQIPKIFPESSSLRNSYKGEAVTVDLGNKGIIVAVMTYEPYRPVFEVFPYPDDMRRSLTKKINYYDELKGKKSLLLPDEEPNWHELLKWKKGYLKTTMGREEIARGQLPVLVYFPDKNNQRFSMKVNPRNLENTLGRGVRLVSAAIEMTDDPVTWEIEEKLPWLKGGGRVDIVVDGHAYGQVVRLNRAAFIRND